MKKGKKLVASVVIPIYNAEKNIVETLDALNHQTVDNFEVVLVDDGSKDDSLKIIREYKSKFKKKVISQENSGPAAARNLGAKSSDSEIIIFLDSDCVPYENFVEEMIKPFEDKEIVGVHGQYETKNKNSFIARYIGYEMAYRQEPMKKAERIDHMATHAAAYRKKDFGEGFSTGFRHADMEDIEFSYRLAKEGKKMVFRSSAKIKHPHPEKFSKFVKQQFGRGYWRVLGHIKHPEKIVKDSYMGNSIAVQGLLSVLFFILTLIYIFSIMLFGFLKFLYLPLIGIVIIYLSNIPLGIYCFKYEKNMLILAPAMAVIRSISATLGFLLGMVNFVLLKRDK